MNKPSYIIIHHSGVNSFFNQLTPINRYHKSKEFPLSRSGWYVGYHYLIEKDGRTIQTRDIDEIGAHTLGGWNMKSIGVCLVGNFHKSVPNKKQLAALNSIIIQHSLPYIFHKEADYGRTCAGFYFTEELIKTEPVIETVAEINKRESIQKQISLIKILIEQIKRLLLIKLK